MNGLFGAGVSFSRVNPIGLALMAVAVVLVSVAKPVARRFWSGHEAPLRIIGLLLCCAGAFIAICL